MGFPHRTVDVPGWWPDLAAEVALVLERDDSSLARDLYRAVTVGATVSPCRPTGHVCATAFVVRPDRRTVLLVRHPRPGWSNPGGHLEVGETTRDAVERELAEETGLAGPDLVPLGPVAVHVTDVDSTADAPAHRHWNVAWAFELATPDAALVPEGGAPLAWVDVVDLPALHAAGESAPDLLATWERVAGVLGVD